jgi:hypothetical protein
MEATMPLTETGLRDILAFFHQTHRKSGDRMTMATLDRLFGTDPLSQLRFPS